MCLSIIVKTVCYSNLMGKTFTVDPISKRRLENMGEEDQFYLRDHHEPIISAELFNKVQEILKRRGQGRIQADGKREMFTRKYSLSCMIKCGFCGGSLTRRCWHSGTQYSKAVWQCVTVTKGGRKFCPDSKEIEEWQIEQAFVDSYQMLCTDNKSIIDEFIARVEQALSENSVLKEIEQLKREINGLENKNF